MSVSATGIGSGGASGGSSGVDVLAASNPLARAGSGARAGFAPASAGRSTAPATNAALTAAFARSSNRNLAALNAAPGASAAPVIVAGVAVVQAARAGEENAKVGLAEGWAAHWSNSRAVWYWRRESTGETVWEKPTAKAAAAADAPNATVAADAAGATANASEEAPLPDGWTAIWSDADQAYYYSDAAGATSWNRPT